MCLGSHPRFSTSTLSTGGPFGWFPFNTVLSFLFPHARLCRECSGIRLLGIKPRLCCEWPPVRYFDLFVPSLLCMWRYDIARAVLTATGEVSDSMPVKGQTGTWGSEGEFTSNVRGRVADQPRGSSGNSTNDTLETWLNYPTLRQLHSILITAQETKTERLNFAQFTQHVAAWLRFRLFGSAASTRPV